VNHFHHAVLRLFPTGRSLPHDSWVRRHNQICALLWLHVVVVPIFAVLRGEALSHAVFEGAIVGLFAIGAAMGRFATIRARLWRRLAWSAPPPSSRTCPAASSRCTSITS
jgi:hypothetical protein